MTERVRKSGLILCLVASWALARAEVSVDLVAGGRVHAIVLAEIVDGPDPIGQLWLAYRPEVQGRILNAAGYARGDGRPDVASRPDGSPVAIWSYNAGSDHDIALSEWTGESWTPIEFITNGPADELDPRIFVAPDGTLIAVWWVDEVVDRVLLTTKPPGAALWSAPVQVTLPNESGRRPSVVVSSGILRVAYEREMAPQSTPLEAVIVRQEPADGFTQEFVAPSSRTDRLDPLLHAENSSLWLDWMQESSDFGSTESDPLGWGVLQTAPWTSPSWVGVEETRRRIRGQVLSP